MRGRYTLVPSGFRWDSITVDNVDGDGDVRVSMTDENERTTLTFLTRDEVKDLRRALKTALKGEIE